MRVVIADPPAYTPWYDHELAGALGRAGADVELHTSYFRFAELPPARRLPTRRALLPALVAALPALAGAAAAEGDRASRRRCVARAHQGRRPARAVARAAAGRRARAAPEPRRSSRRTTCCRAGRPRSASSGSGCSRRFDRVVVHTERGQEALRELGVEPVVISHPVYPSHAQARRRRADDPRARRDPAVQGARGRGRGHARASSDARLLVAGDPAMPLGALRDTPRTEWRLGYLTPAELDRALSEATSRSSPTGPSSTSRARSSRRSARASRRSPTTSAGWPSRSRATARAASVPAGDVEALTEAARELLADPAGARGGPRGRRARPPRADLGRRRREPPRAVPGARVIFRRAAASPT